MTPDELLSKDRELYRLYENRRSKLMKAYIKEHLPFKAGDIVRSEQGLFVIENIISRITTHLGSVQATYVCECRPVVGKLLKRVPNSEPVHFNAKQLALHDKTPSI